MQVTTRALVISAIKYGEADLVGSCFTESYGLKSYHLRGILKHLQRIRYVFENVAKRDHVERVVKRHWHLVKETVQDLESQLVPRQVR